MKGKFPRWGKRIAIRKPGKKMYRCIGCGYVMDGAIKYRLHKRMCMAFLGRCPKQTKQAKEET